MRVFARLVVSLRAVIPVAWIAAAVLVTIHLPPLGATGSAPLDDLVSQGGGAAQEQQRATRMFGFPLYTDTVVVQRAPGGLPQATQERAARAALAVRDHRAEDLPNLRAVLPVSDAATSPLAPGDRATTALSYLFFSDAAGLDERRDMADRYARRYLGGEHVVGTTGAAPARLAQYEEIQRALPIVEAASIALVLIITALAFRSLGAPLVTLFAAAIAYLIAIRVLPWAGQKAGADVPAEVEPIIVVLLLGLVTDYSVFFLSETRRRLRRGQDRRQAALAATRRTAPIVFTAGLIVAAGTGALVVGKLGFFRAFGPGLALTTLIALAVSITLVPALLALFGARLYGGDLRRRGANGPDPRQDTDARTIERARRGITADRPGRAARLLAFTRPRTALSRTRELAGIAQTSHWRLIIARIASARPVALPIGVACIAALAILATGASRTQLGLGFISALPPGNVVREAATAASDGFAPGVLSPTEIDLEQPEIATRRPELAKLEALVRAQPGVAAVIGPTRQPPPPAPPILVTRDGNAARLAVVFDSDPLGAPAIDKLQALQSRLPALLRQSGLGAPRTGVGGETALAQATVEGVLHDLRRIGIVAIAVNLLLLMLFLRAVIAPLYLVGVSVLGLAASLGVTTFVFQDVLGHDDLTYYVPFAAAVLLVALGSDYNVFVAGRIWEEARWMRLREAIAVATPAAAKAVTVAGIALAASFALLVAIPLRSFREFAFVMAAGVLLDTFIVRSLLVPALTSLFGEAAWWPGRRVRGMPAEEIVERVADRAGLPWEEAELLTQGTLAALGERISGRERRTLAHHLPRELREALTRSGEGPQRFSKDEFLARARARAGGDGVTEAEMAGYAGAVLSTLGEAVPDDLAYVRAQLSEDYDPLFA
ncbi:MMPL family transporter [Candidatus Solirubrobacter pratensis]|uniref:MMPL family transporter n=1 Tax=Candidatus Solirubrobacter pratensis TaxID=1298857 RepID=UPI00040168CB|nr:MMPL family transporter [Candidatus Solirubrobacter pratensis]